ncbi:hypothetical protein PUNSTDRAFT_146787 [Punctularia strigosozonata HHB-11173 SS5]|uniref:Protein kinase domain-containing protein n=1 Tax=Punctularia strigosozonata (strain HHB-11173) TaxID=741275 RepID=R7S0Z1_PUNST|nr:uncharacterized protein PUNSTDRAFT_146787 [Punctularia strigosozonata HHB-11173 SS5]EIN04050.1 hypothetical protein PUNSTDRAFT_146787 [Punctularia strigosozonata HHB-11173 SS5]
MLSKSLDTASVVQLNIIQGLLDGGVHPPVRLSRESVPEDYVPRLTFSCTPPDDVPPHPLSPHPADPITLEVILGAEISSGRVGVAYRLESARALSLDGSVVDMRVPPLVVKIAGEGFSDTLAREAWFYDDMRHCQGSVVARCYGFFEAPLPEPVTPIPWTAHQSPHSSHGSGSKCSDKPSNETSIIFSPENKNKRPIPRGKGRQLSILLLEDLGEEKLPLGPAMTIDLRQEILSLIDELDYVRIVHGDIRHNHIRRAPSHSPSLSSPYTGRTYDWRLIDFDRAMKCDAPTDYVNALNSDIALGLLDGLAEGYVMEPWELF